MTTNFDNLPVSITPETIDMVARKFNQMQIDGFDANGQNFANPLVQATVYSFLESAAEFPTDLDLLLAFAAMVMCVVESTIGASYE